MDTDNIASGQDQESSRRHLETSFPGHGSILELSRYSLGTVAGLGQSASFE